MKPLLTGVQMKEADRFTIEQFGLKSLILMERAALSVAEAIMREYPLPGRIFIMAGTGNNGADGLALARILFQRGWQIRVLVTGSTARGTEQWQYQKRLLDSLGVCCGVCEDEGELSEALFPQAQVYADALLGVGLSRPVEGMYRKAVELWNRRGRQWEAFCVAVDICSGIDANTGAILGVCTKADLTVTFGYGKAGQYLYPAAAMCGRVVTAEIGLAPDAVSGFADRCLWTLEREDAAAMLPVRVPWGNKGTFGRVLVIAGSQGMAGAAYFSARAACLAGAGLVCLATVRENCGILQQLLPQAILKPYDEDTDFKEWLPRLLQGVKAIVIGPGLSVCESAAELLKEVIRLHAGIPLVIDADGLNLLADTEAGILGAHTILTPHPGELSRLLSVEVSALKADMAGSARRLLARYGAVSVCKDARTFIACPSGRVYLNLIGNDGMAVGGSGDVLTGVIAALAAQGLDEEKAALLGVWLHARAGDLAAEQVGRFSLTAEDLLLGIPKAFRDLTQEA